MMFGKRYNCHIMIVGESHLPVLLSYLRLLNFPSMAIVSITILSNSPRNTIPITTLP